MYVEKYLIDTPLFAGISVEDIQALLKETRYQTKKYRNQETFIFQNSPCTYLYFLYQGHATAGRMNLAGKYLLVEELYAPKVIAPAFLFNKENRYPVTVNATKVCSVLIIPGQDFIRLLQKNKQLLFNFLSIISNQVVYLSQKVKISRISPLRERLQILYYQIVKKELLFSLRDIRSKSWQTCSGLLVRL